MDNIFTQDPVLFHIHDGRLGIYRGCIVEEAVCQSSSSFSVRNCPEPAKGLQKDEITL